MTDLIEIIKTIQTSTNTLVKMTNNKKIILSTSCDDIDDIISSAQLSLITKIAHDYNINIKELTRKYLTKSKKDTKVDDDDDSPTMQLINETKNMQDDVANDSNANDSENDSDADLLNLLVQAKTVTKAKRGRKPGSKSKKTVIAESIDSEVLNEVVDEVDEKIYKPLTIKGKSYVLLLSTNEIYDMDNNLVGRKKDDKILEQEEVKFIQKYMSKKYDI